LSGAKSFSSESSPPQEIGKRFPERAAWAAVGIALLVLCVIVFYAYRTIAALVRSEAAVAHSHRVQTALQDFRADLLTTQTARRGYVITGDAAELQPIRPLLEVIPAELEGLKKLTADNPTQQRTLAQLRPLVQEQLDLLHQSIASEAGVLGPEDQARITHDGTRLVGQISALLAQMDSEESRLLQKRQSRSGETYSRTLLLFTAAFVIAVVVLMGGFNALLHELHRRKLAEQTARSQEDVLNAFFASSPLGLAIVDAGLRFQKVNAFLGEISGLPGEQHIGRTAGEVWGEFAAEIEPMCRQVLSTGQPVLNQELSRPPDGGSPGTHWIVNYFPLQPEQGQCQQAGIVVLDITLRRQAEDAARRLSTRLLHLQDTERRRMARELHDSLGQYLTALTISIEQLSCEHPSPAFTGEERAKLWSEAREVLQRALAETRTISHLLHPPLLDETGLTSAARWYVEGFGKRSGIEVNLEIPPDLGRLPEGVELALFRALQECLTNVHRHSGSDTVDVRITRDAAEAGLEVEDHGCGMPQALLRRLRASGSDAGVGLAGMRERVHDLRGKLEIDSGPAGTRVRVRIPLGRETSPESVVPSPSKTRVSAA